MATVTMEMPAEPGQEATRLHAVVASGVGGGDHPAAEAAMREILHGAHQELDAVLGFE